MYKKEVYYGHKRQHIAQIYKMQRGKSMKKRMMAFLAALAMLLSCVPFGALVTAEAAEDLVLKLHYHRADGQYDGWDVWLWEEGKDGAGYPFEEENGEMVATKVLTPGTTSVGFIVRTQDWTKDIGEDQFIDIAEMVSGTVHIYVESGVKGYTKEYGEDAVTGVKLSKARYNGEGTIITKFTGEIVAEDLVSYFKVNGPDGEVAIKEVKTEANNEYHLVLAEELNGSRNYTVFCDGTEYKVVMPIIFSTDKFEEQYTYTGKDLGATYTKDKTTFRVWAPTADKVAVRLYQGGEEGKNDLIEELSMTADVNGTWVLEKSGDLNGTYYTYFVTIGDVQNEACDPYARTTGVNGKRAMVIDLDSTDPEGWENDKNPNAGKTFNDAVIYELHVRDLSIDKASGIKNRGKYLAFTETGTTNEQGIPTGIDHIKNLGVTHVHLLPVYDYGSVDETKSTVPQFNWGYDPVNYNVPEGSYSTDAYNGEVRVKEFKQMVQSMHNNGLSVIMDVVYNHVYNASEFCFNKIVPQYFTRIDENGTYSNGSGCGNDTASERSMVKKYIVESVLYWAEEYHIDGFRFDLVGLLDTETINEIVETVHAVRPDVVFYGEGWSMNTNITKFGYQMATQVNSKMTPGFAYFSDTIRDALKGSVFNNTETGYISGASGKESTLEKCFMGLAYPWCSTPSQCINYASCHDNMTLFDRIVNSTPDASREDQIKMNNLAAAIYMTSQGIPFVHAGEEMLRSKPKKNGGFDENSYASSDSVNKLKWEDLNSAEYQDVYNYYKGLIAFRKEHAALRMTTAEEVKANITAVEGLEKNVMAFQINGGVNGEVADNLFVIFNSNETETEIELPEGKWNVYIDGENAGTEVLRTASGKVKVAPISAMVLCQGGAAAGLSGGAIAGIAAGVAVLGAAVAVVLKKKKK